MIPHFAGETSIAPSRTSASPPFPTLEASALIVLTQALRHKLRVYDVVSSLVGLHHMEAAVAPTVERPSEQKDLSGCYLWHLTHLFINMIFFIIQ